MFLIKKLGFGDQWLRANKAMNQLPEQERSGKQLAKTLSGYLLALWLVKQIVHHNNASDLL